MDTSLQVGTFAAAAMAVGGLIVLTSGAWVEGLIALALALLAWLALRDLRRQRNRSRPS
jgi:hypothetical protein